jgi:outer membrane protein
MSSTLHSYTLSKFVEALLFLAGAASAQDTVLNTPNFSNVSTAPQSPFAPTFASAADPKPPIGAASTGARPDILQSIREQTFGSERIRRITLEQVKQSADRLASVPARMAQLSVEAARQHRLGVQADYFPKFGAVAGNLHYTEFLGQLVTVRRLGMTTQVVVPIFSQNQTFAVLTFTQPLTPLLQVHQAVKIARADERIAMSKAASLSAQNARHQELEATYFKLLIAQRKLILAKAKLRGSESRPPVHAVVSTGLDRAPGQEPELAEAKQAVESTAAEVEDLSASLNRAIGWSEDTEWELAIPDPLVENISIQDVNDRSIAANPDVVVAEQTVVKARAASTLSKLTYVPTVAAVAGYMFQNVIPAVASNYGYGGVIASYNLFDFGKREHTVKEAHIQFEIAELALQATKTKVAADLKKSYLELEHSRQISQVAQRMWSSLALIMTANSNGESVEVEVARAAAEVEMLEADLAHRQAFARLEALMGQQRERGRSENHPGLIQE